jgi:xanthine dehydrogenase accessory factor
VRADLDVPDALRSQLHTPAGLDIGARTPAEVAISILAEIISSAHAGVVAPVATAVDPVCGMTVATSDATVHLGLPGGERVYFCGTGCRDAYAALHAERG